MPKDAKGHGSNARGGSYSNIDRNLRGPGRHVGYADGTWHISKSGRGYQATHQRTNDMLFSDSLGGMSKKLSDQAAARQLASGPKSAPAPVHDAMVDHDPVKGHLQQAARNALKFGADHVSVKDEIRKAAKSSLPKRGH